MTWYPPNQPTWEGRAQGDMTPAEPAKAKEEAATPEPAAGSLSPNQ